MITGTDTRFRNLERKVGIFVLVALLGGLGVFIFIVKENDFFKSTYAVTLTAPKGTGFSQGMPIKLSGFRIGRVKSITLNDSAAVDVLLQIDRKYKKWMRKDSVARLIKEGIIGDYIVEINSGSSNELIPENGVITLGKTKAIDEIAEEIADKVKPVLMDIRDIISYLNSEDGDLKQTFRNLQVFTRNIEESRARVDDLLANGTTTVDSAGKRFDILLSRTGSRLDQVEPILGKVDNSLLLIEKKLPQLLNKIEITLDNLGEVSKDLKGASAENLPKIPGLINKAEGVIGQGEGLLEGAKLLWPLSSTMPPSDKKSLLRRDSNE